jgi:hypothetical protein
MGMRKLLLILLLIPGICAAQTPLHKLVRKKTGGAFVPTDIASLTGWYPADQIGGLSDGDPIPTWADQSGTGNDLTSSGTARPTLQTGELNSLPVVRLDGSDDFMEKASFSGLDGVSGMTIFLVVKMASYSNDQTFISKWDYATQGSFAWQSAYDNANPNEQTGVFIADAITDVGGNKAESTDNTTLSSFCILTMVYDGSQSNANRIKFYFNGAALTVSTSGTIATSLTTATSSLKIGKFGGALSRFFNGDMAEIAIFNTALPGPDQSNMVTYLNSKYSVF